jgi:hypothetical protein
VQHGPVLGRVDVLPGEHRLDALPQPGPPGERQQRVEHLVGDQVLAVVDVQVGHLGGEPLPPPRVAREQITQVHTGELLGVPGHGLPLGAVGKVLAHLPDS